MTIETIKKLKEVGLFDDFKKAMEILVEETKKQQIEWDIKKLNFNGLKHNHETYRWKLERYPDLKYEYDVDLAELKTASEYFETFKVYYSDDDFKMSGLDFGCIKWNLHTILKKEDNFATYDSYIKGEFEYDFYSHYEYINKVTDISFSCFRSKTPREILNVIEGRYDLELN